MSNITEIPKLITDTSPYFQYEGSTNATTQDELQAFMKNEHGVVEALTNAILWQPSTAYEKGQEVRSPNMPAGFTAVCKVAGISGTNEPDWGTGGTDVTDASCTWTVTKGNITVNGKAPDASGNITVDEYSPDYASDSEAITGTSTTKIMTPKATDAVIENIGYWKPNEAVSLNVIRFIRGTAYSGYYLICNTAGTTGSTEPKPTAGTTALVSDGTVKWYLRKMTNQTELDSVKSLVTGSGVSNLGSIQVTASTQSTLNLPGYYAAKRCRGGGSFSYLGMNAGVSGGTYTLKNLLQQLVNKSHGHVSKSQSYNCDCDCGDSTCIVSGNIKTNKGYIAIGELKVGDLVFNGKNYETCVGIVDRKVGQRGCIGILDNGKLIAIITSDHPIKGDNDTVLVANKEGFYAENNIIFTDRYGNKAGYFLENEVVEFNKSFCVDDRKYQVVQIQLPEETRCYLPVLKNGGVCYLDSLPVYAGKEA